MVRLWPSLNVVGIDPWAPSLVSASLVRLRTVLWGGCLENPGQVGTLLKGTGFVDVRTLAMSPGAIVALIAAPRASDQ
jgi:hypothetical protein